MATNHEVGSSNLSERATLKTLEDPTDTVSEGFFDGKDHIESEGEKKGKGGKKDQSREKVGNFSNGFLSVPQVAKILSVDPKTVTQWCQSGKLPAMAKPYGTKTSWLISPHALELLAHQNEQQKASSKKATQKEAEQPIKAHSAFIEVWETAMKTGLMTGKPFSPHTSGQYKSNVTLFLLNHSKLCPKTLQMALMLIPAHQYSKKARLYDALNSFAKFLIRENIIEPHFCDEVKHLKPKRHLPPKRITVDESGLQCLLNACESAFERLLVILPASTGLRASEACALKWADIDLIKGFLIVRLAKGGKTRRVGLSSVAIQVIKDHMQEMASKAMPSEPIFLNRLEKEMDRHGLRQRLERLGQSAGVTVSPHALRRAFVTINANKGRPLQMLQMACGHSDIKTTMSYCRTAEQEVIEAMKGWD